MPMLAPPYALSTRDIFTIGLNLPALHNLASGILLGSIAWHTAIGGPIAFVTIPRMQFGNLQGRIFPIFFAMQTGVSALLLGSWLYMHPQLKNNLSLLTELSRPDSFNAHCLVLMTVTGAINSFLVGPMTTKVMKDRHRLEREEGKKYTDLDVSDKMKGLNKQFGTLHGISSLLNLGFLFASIWHQLYLGRFGVL